MFVVFKYNVVKSPERIADIIVQLRVTNGLLLLTEAGIMLSVD